MPQKPDSIAVIRFLSGPQRGRAEIIDGKTVFLIAPTPDDVRIAAPDGRSSDSAIGTLHKHGSGYELEIPVTTKAWVNGNRIDEKHALQSGDVLELGASGTVLRYRLYPKGVVPKKTLGEAVSDSMEVAKVDSHSRFGRAGQFVTRLSQDLATQTTLWFRVSTLVLIALLIIAIALLIIQNYRFQQQLSSESIRIESIAKILEKTGQEAMTSKDLETLRGEVQQNLADAAERVASLEAQSGSYARVISDTSQSIAFIQGEYGYVDANSGRSLRYIKADIGSYLFTLEEEAELVAIPFSGTAFVATPDGLLVTNQHVAEPWQMTSPPPSPEHLTLEPEIQRMRAFFPGQLTSTIVLTIRIADSVDLALLQPGDGFKAPKSLDIELTVPVPGEEVLVLGYPLGLSGIAARASPEIIAEVKDEELEYWERGDRLASEGYIEPLASRGIVGQVTENFIVYDAETTLGGSGGPVLNLQGKVIAVNTATMGDFGGSNLGVPAAQLSELLKPVAGETK